MKYDTLPSYVKPDIWLDDNNLLEFVRWKDETEPYMAHWWHRNARTSTGWCFGSFAWRNPAPSVMRDGALWELHSMEPLTVSPSLLCLVCKAHGFIRNSTWMPC